MIETIQFPIRGMTCASCVNRIVRALRELDGVDWVKVDLRRESATVRRDHGVVSNEDLASAVAAAGYAADLDAMLPVPTVERIGLVAQLIARARW